jgi:hypothetical protein
MRPFLVSLIALAGCFPVHISGSNVPTDNTVQLTEADIAAAEGYIESCKVDLVSDDAQEVVDQALAELEDRGVDVVERNHLKFTTAFRGRLEVEKGFWNTTVERQAMILTHELVHYCQRDQIGNRAFIEAYENSPGRWVIEVPGEAQFIRTGIAVGYEGWSAEKYIDDRLPRMRDFYWLHDLEPVQYSRETRRIWESVL